MLHIVLVEYTYTYPPSHPNLTHKISIEKGLSSELDDILRWSDEGRHFIYNIEDSENHIFGDQTTPSLHGACYFGHLDIVKIIYKYLIISFRNINIYNKLSEDEMQRKLNDVLISKLNYKMKSGHTALYLAAQRGFVDIVKFLIAKGSETTTVAPNKYTPLSVLS